MSAAATLIFIVSLTLAGTILDHGARLSQAVIFQSDGLRTEVQVSNFGTYFCPSYCHVNHRHRVHDIRWSCGGGKGCGHYTVFHRILGRGQTHPGVHPPLDMTAAQEPVLSAAPSAPPGRL